MTQKINDTTGISLETIILAKNICIVKRKELRITLRRGYSSFCRLFQNRVEWSNGQYFPILSFSIFSGDILRSISFLISNSGMFAMPCTIYYLQYIFNRERLNK